MARVSNMLGVQERGPNGEGMEVNPYHFPKMVYRATSKHPKGYVTKVVHSQAEVDALPKGWLTTPAEIHGLLDPIHRAAHAKPEDDENFFDDTAPVEAAAATEEVPAPKAKRERKPKAAAATV